MKFKKVFWKGKIIDEWSDDLEGAVNDLRKGMGYLHDLRVDDIIDFLDKVAKSWKDDEDFKKKFGLYLNGLIDFMRKGNLEAMVGTALRKREALDGFVKLNDNPVLYHAQPRGLSVHWVAGNVPMLGVFSFLQALLTKNPSLIKASSREYNDFLVLLESFNKVDTPKIRGKEILESVAVILVDRENRDVMESLSVAADIRIAFGGKEAIDSIMGLKKRFHTEDIIYGPKYSYAAIDKESLKDHKKLAQRFAIDVSVFDQYACSSPHTLFIEKGGEIKPEEFAEELASQLSLVNRTLLPKGKTEPGKVMDILKIKAKYEMMGRVFSSPKNEWTVVYSEEGGLADPCFSRVIFVRPIDDINSVSGFGDHQKQSIGLAVSGNRRFGFADKATLHGVDRCPSFGNMNLFESPWDGMFAMDRMVRWVTCYE